MKSRCTQKGVFGLLVMMLVLATSAFATDYYVATDGDDNDPGTIGEPFATIQHAADVMSAGDTCYIRAGTYHEEVAWTTGSLDGTSGSPVTFTNYQNEEVILDGTEAITGAWTQHSGNIYKISYATDIWQLFDDGEMMIPARWPNHNPSDDFWMQDQIVYWAQGDVTKDTNGHMYDVPHDSVDLAASNLNMQGAMAVLNVGSFKTGTRSVNSHTGGDDDFTYNAVSFTFKDKHHYYFMEAKLNLLDAEKEWYYDSSADLVYLWSPGGGSPSGTIKGKTQSYAFDVTGCDYITIKGLKFFGNTVSLSDCENIIVEDCEFSYPSCSKRMLGNITTPETTNFTNCYSCTLKNCVIEYTDGHAYYINGDNNVVENNYIHHIDWSCAELPNLMVSVYNRGNNNTFKRNTVHTCGASALMDVGNAIDCELNRYYNTGYLQSDGSIVQVMVLQQTNNEIHYNWIHDTPKMGTRFDGAGGTGGLIHHQVAWDLNAGVYVGNHDYEKIYCNLGFDSDPRNEMVIESTESSNQNTITRNNAAPRIGATNTGSEQVPGTYDHNWNGYDEEGDIRDLFRDLDRLDFRPKSGSDVVDAGIVINGITDGYLGTAPDIGPYEYGCTNYWIPGCKFEKASTPVPPDDAYNVKTDADLMWLEGLDATSNNVYFGTASGSLTYQSNQSTNIYDPGTLSSDTSYYWRIDTVTASDTITGDEWVFYTGAGGGGEPDVTLTDDTFVNSGAPTSNFGSLGSMRVTVDNRFSYLKFTVSDTGGAVNSATLDVKSYLTGYDDTTAYSVTGDWDESTLTWNNDDLTWGSSLDTNSPIAAETWYAFDVSNAITGDGTFTIGLKTTASGSTNRWYTKESSDVPVLTVYTSAPDTTPPAAPTGLSATGGTSQITLDWNDNTEGDLDGYNVYRTVNPGETYEKINTSLVTPSAYTDSSVSNNTTYYYYVKAVDTSSNVSTASNVDYATPILDTTPPAAPTNLGATPGNEEVSLDWDDNTESDLDGYNVYRSTTSGSGFSKINGSLVSASEYTDSSVTNDTTYYFKATAVDVSSNESGYSNEDSATPSAPQWTQLTYDDFESGWGNYTSGGVDAKLYTDGTYAHQGTACADLEDDTGVTASFYHTNGIDVATPGYTQIKVEFWFKTISFDNSAEDFWVQYFDGTDWHTVATYVYDTDFQNDVFYDKTGANAVYIDEGTGEGEYTFPTDMKIRFMCDASGGADDAYIDEIKVSGLGGTPDTTAPATPTGLGATPGDTQVSLDWNDNTEGDLDGYNVYRSTTSGSGFSKINGSLVSASSYTDNTVSNGTTYYYKVTAVDTSSNESGYSSEVSALPVGWTQLTYDDFESGWGNYTDGGTDCYLYVDGTYAHQGDNAGEIRDDVGEDSSFYYTSGLDVDTAGYTQIKIEFWFYPRSMDNSDEDFWVQYYDGTDWNTVASYAAEVDFENGSFYDKTGENAVVIDEGTGEGEYTFPTDMKIRFMCDASGDADYIYIDEVKVSAK